MSLKAATLTLTFPLSVQRGCHGKGIYNFCFLINYFKSLFKKVAETRLGTCPCGNLELQKVGKELPKSGKRIRRRENGIVEFWNIGIMASVVRSTLLYINPSGMM